MSGPRPEVFTHAGRDDEIRWALEHNPSPLLRFEQIAAVLRFAGYSPEGGGSMDIAAIVWTSDNRFFALEGGCDYTGWDCQSDLDVTEHANAHDAFMNGITADGRALIERTEADA